MKRLSPYEAADIASAVYDVINTDNLSNVFKTHVKDNFDIPAGTRFKGSTGAMVFKSKSGFGVIAKGKGQFQGDALIAIRGTKQMPQDLLTNANVGIQVSSTGKMVHAGFNKTFKSFENDITGFLRGINPNRVHCVGHSLGGALASLAADVIAEKNIAQPVLYTFGSPRVGMSQFAESFTNKVKDNNIFRVCHHNDPVTMLPLWPFTHVPKPGTECFIKSNESVFTTHFMTNYTKSVVNVRDWNTLKVKQPQMNWDAEIETWLGSKSVISFTAHTIKMINNVIMYLIRKIFHLLGIGIQGAFTTGLTFLDQLSMLLEKGARASTEVAGHVMSLLQKIMSMLGRAVRSVAELTLDFIRYVFTTLSRSLYQMANMAVSAVHSALP